MANLFVSFSESTDNSGPTPTPTPTPTQTPALIMTNPLSIKFDFSHYDAKPEDKTVVLPSSQCDSGSFIVVAEADGLITGKLYDISFELLNPLSNRPIFIPTTVSIFASTQKQKITTVATVDYQYYYILKVNIQEANTNIIASDMYSVSCQSIPPNPSPTPTPSSVPLARVLFDSGPIYNVVPPDRCTEQLNIIATIYNSKIGKTYKYEFVPLSTGIPVSVSPPSGLLTAGSDEQNINTVLNVGSMNNTSLLSLQVNIYDMKYPNIILDEDILLIRCYDCQTRIENSMIPPTPTPTPTPNGIQ